MWCTIKLSSGAKLLLGCIYRSHNSDDENKVKLNELVCKADLFPVKYKCIVGDFNLPSINWRLGDCKDPKPLAFINTTLNCFLTQNVSNPTRHRDGQHSNLLDLIFTNDENLKELGTSRTHSAVIRCLTICQHIPVVRKNHKNQLTQQFDIICCLARCLALCIERKQIMSLLSCESATLKRGPQLCGQRCGPYLRH